MKLFEILAAIGLVAEDIFVVFALVGAVSLFLWRTANLFSRRRHKAPVLIVWGAIFGWLLSTICLASLEIAGWKKQVGQYVARLSLAQVTLLVLLSLVLIL